MKMKLIDKIKEKAKNKHTKIVLAEGEDERTIKSAQIALNEGLAELVMLGNADQIKSLAGEIGFDLGKIEIIDPEAAPIEKYIKSYVESRSKSGKHVTEGMAEKLIRRSLYFGTAMVDAGDVDGMVAGCSSLTATVVKASQLMIGLREGITAPSSYFIMSVPNCPYGEDGNFIYADAGVNPDPTPQELAEIAVLSAYTAKDLLGWEPRVAMLSFSTKGSAAHHRIDKVIEATKLAKEMAPDISIDGEFQLDAAIIPEVAQRKVKESSPVAGRANVLIFPDLDAGNIAYKLTQYLAKADAYGPLLQGFAKPVNDLSRGASADDIVGVIAITSVQAQK
jgi:phosphate acetyltransferase